MHGGRGKSGAQGETAVVHINTQLKAIPGFRLTLGVFPDAAVIDRRKQSEGCHCRLGTLNVKPRRFGRLSLFSLKRPPFWQVFCLPGSHCRHLTPRMAFELRQIVSNQFHDQMFFPQSTMNQRSGEIGKCTQESCFEWIIIILAKPQLAHRIRMLGNFCLIELACQYFLTALATNDPAIA